MSENSTPNKFKIVRISSTEMCRIFNDDGYWEKVKNGELQTFLLEACISKLLTHETCEIQSQMLSYRDSTGEEVARIHQFVRPDGTLAASGKPDPKRLLKDGILYRLEKKPK
jgi:hypothetical protein